MKICDEVLHRDLWLHSQLRELPGCRRSPSGDGPHAFAPGGGRHRHSKYLRSTQKTERKILRRLRSLQGERLVVAGCLQVALPESISHIRCRKRLGLLNRGAAAEIAERNPSPDRTVQYPLRHVRIFVESSTSPKGVPEAAAIA